MAPFIVSRGVRRGFVPLLSSKASKQYGREGMLLGYEHSDEEGLGEGRGLRALVWLLLRHTRTYARAQIAYMNEERRCDCY